MFRVTAGRLHKGGRSRRMIHKDPMLQQLGQGGLGTSSLVRMGVRQRTHQGFRKLGFFGQSPYDHAFPLLSHDELGHSDQSNDTQHVLLASYMPKRNKGMAPWFRGADTYSVKYSEQGRYEYHRYLMVNRMPSMYKREFTRFLRYILGVRNAGAYGRMLPQEAVYWIQRMIVDNFNPQHVHYIAALDVLRELGECDLARDIWVIMERQQTFPCDRTIASYLDVCIAAGQKEWAFECWNRYCTEKTFLQSGETDPKPLTRVPFTLNRDEMFYLPKWKKHFDHNPNLDVTDRNRFNITRVLYSKMAIAMLVCGEFKLFEQFFLALETAMLTTPTPVPQPVDPLFIEIPKWAPYEAATTIEASAWRLDNSSRAQALGPSVTAVDELNSRFFSNTQYLAHTVGEAARSLVRVYFPPLIDGPAAEFGRRPADIERAARDAEVCRGLYSRVRDRLGKEAFAGLMLESTIAAMLLVHRRLGMSSGAATLEYCRELLKDTDGVNMTGPMYLQILNAFADEAARGAEDLSTFKPVALVSALCDVVREMVADPHLEWGADMHLAIMQVMVQCGTMGANNYFVKNVLRKFEWGAPFLEVLYPEYRRASDVDTWAELTKRALVWTARYDVIVSERLKEMIEADYATIHVQVRTFRELAVFQFRDVEEKRVTSNPVNALPNPWIDYVSHALPFPDRDNGYPNEYGDIGQWRAPSTDGIIKGPGYYAPGMTGEFLRGYTSEWRDSKDPARAPPFPNPWENKYKEYNRGQHPSYDMTYAGPMPEIFPTKRVFKPKTRWDYQDIHKQSKTVINGPY